MEATQELLKSSLSRLAAETESSCSETTADLPRLANLIRTSMDTESRVYHRLSHALDVAAECSQDQPVPILAALFHDIIYLTVDKKVLPCQEQYLSDLVQNCEEGEWGVEFLLKNPLPAEKWDLIMVDTVFGGHVEGRNTNEYFSAILAIRALEGILGRRNLLELVVCIEASVPFRAAAPDGKSAMDQLFEKTRRYCRERGFDVGESIDDGDIRQMVKQAAFFANCDLASFSSPDIGRFVALSWQLLPEWWPALTTSSPTLMDVYSAIDVLVSRYKGMTVENLFQHFQGSLSTHQLAAMRKQATANLEIAGRYALIRLYGVGTIVSLLKRTLGEDWLGKLDKAVTLSKFHDRFALTVPACTNYVARSATPTRRNEGALQLLQEGRNSGYCWDPAYSPWEIYLCAELGTEKVVELARKHAKGVCWIPELPDTAKQCLLNILASTIPEYSDEIRRDEYA